MQKGFFCDGKKNQIKPEDSQYELGVVSYPGNGKYDDSTIYVPIHELPDVEETASERQLQIISPPGQGWWPVIALQTKAASPFEIDHVWGPTVVTKKIFIVCFYQLLSDGQVIGWWVNVTV